MLATICLVLCLAVALARAELYVRVRYLVMVRSLTAVLLDRMWRPILPFTPRLRLPTRSGILIALAILCLTSQTLPTSSYTLAICPTLTIGIPLAATIDR